MDAYFKYFGSGNAHTNVLVNDKELLKKYNKILTRIKDLFGKEFNSELGYKNRYIKTKIQSQFTNFKGNEISINGKNSTLFSIFYMVRFYCLCIQKTLSENTTSNMYITVVIMDLTMDAIF